MLDYILKQSKNPQILQLAHAFLLHVKNLMAYVEQEIFCFSDCYPMCK